MNFFQGYFKFGAFLKFEWISSEIYNFNNIGCFYVVRVALVEGTYNGNMLKDYEVWTHFINDLIPRQKGQRLGLVEPERDSKKAHFIDFIVEEYEALSSFFSFYNFDNYLMEHSSEPNPSTQSYIQIDDINKEEVKKFAHLQMGPYAEPIVHDFNELIFYFASNEEISITFTTYSEDGKAGALTEPIILHSKINLIILLHQLFYLYHLQKLEYDYSSLILKIINNRQIKDRN